MADTETDATFSALENAEYFAILSRGTMGFRFGPYTGPEAGKIMEQAVAEGCPVAIAANCGQDFDWTLARDLRGWPAERFPIEAAPRDGTLIVVDRLGVECRARWSVEWGIWRMVNSEGDPGEVIETPRSWRWPDADEMTPDLSFDAVLARAAPQSVPVEAAVSKQGWLRRLRDRLFPKLSDEEKSWLQAW